ncbi:MAG: hypothetical protein ACRCXB_29500 [Aeromonadaceae bacterium]
MKLYEVTAAAYSYDEYDAFIVWAETSVEALDIVRDITANFDTGATVTEVKKPKQSGILLGSFNAG